MRKWALPGVVLAMVLAFSTPALAQSAVRDQYGVEDFDPTAGDTVTATGIVEKQGMTSYQYGSHNITDEASGVFYALMSDQVDLDGYVGQTVTVRGNVVPTTEDGQLEGGPPLIYVTQVEPRGGSPGEAAAVLSFEVATEGPSDEDTTFFGFWGLHGSELNPVRLADPDGDGAYTGSVERPKGETLVVEIVRGTGTTTPPAFPELTFPGEPSSVLRGPETIALDNDATISAFYTFPGGDDPNGDAFSIRGYITSVTGGEVLVEEDPDDPVVGGSGSPKGFFTLTDETEILRQHGDELVAADSSDLAVGQLAEATYAGGAIPAIYPSTGEAGRIVILEAGSGNPPDDPPDNGGDGGSDGGASGGLGVLPDTGGAFLPVPGVGALLVAGGLLARRVTR